MYNMVSWCVTLLSAFQIVSTSDQLVAHFVMRVEGHLPGLPGLFMAGVIAAALRLALQGMPYSGSTKSAVSLWCFVFPDATV